MHLKIGLLAVAAALLAGCGSDDDATDGARAASGPAGGSASAPTITAPTGTDTQAAAGPDAHSADSKADKGGRAKQDKRSSSGKEGAASSSSKSKEASGTRSASRSGRRSSRSTSRSTSRSGRRSGKRSRQRSSSSGGGGPAGGGSPATSATGPAEQPAPRLSPQPNGQFAFDTSGQMQGSGRTVGMPSTTMLDISGGAVQRQVRDLRNPDGEGVYTAVVLVNDDAGVKMRSLELRGKLSTFTDQRTLTASDPLFLSARPQPGEQHEFGLSGSNVNATVTVRVGGKDTVAGASVTWVEVRVQFTGEVTGTTQQDLALTATGFPARERVVSDLKFRVGSSHTEYTVTARQVPGGG